MEGQCLLMKQYEFLRSEIVQCIYLKQVAVIGMFTSLFAIMGAVLGSERTFCLLARNGLLPIAAVGAAFVVNCFGSLYVHEQIRNRRACSLNRAIEYLITCLAQKGADPSPGFVLWENFIVDQQSDGYNRPFYLARTLGIGLPLLLFTVPPIVLLQVNVPPRAETPESLRILITVWPIAVCVLMSLVGAATARRDKPSRRVARSEGFRSTIRRFCTVLYMVPPVVLAIYAVLGGVSSRSAYIALLANLIAICLGLWATHSFFLITTWLKGKGADTFSVLHWLAGRGALVQRAVGNIPDDGELNDDDERLRSALEHAIQSWALKDDE